MLRKYIIIILLSVFILDTYAQSGNDCNSPIIVNAPFSQQYSTQGKGDDYNNNAACEAPYNKKEDIIFSFTPTVTQVYGIVVSNFTSKGPSISVVTTCTDFNTGNCLAFASKSDVGDVSLSLMLTQGTTYFIKVDGEINSNVNSFSNFTFSIFPKADNDLLVKPSGICGYKQLIQDRGCTLGNNFGATTTPSEPNSSCNTKEKTVWYYFDAQSDTVIFSLDNGGTISASEVTLYTSNNDRCDGTLTEMFCNSQSGGLQNPSMVYTEWSGLIPLRRYIIMVDGINGEEGTFCPVVFTKPKPTPAAGSSCVFPRTLYPKASCDPGPGNDGSNQLQTINPISGTVSVSKETYLNASSFSNSPVDSPNPCGDDQRLSKATWVKFKATSNVTNFSNNEIPVNGVNNSLTYTLLTGTCGNLTIINCQIVDAGLSKPFGTIKDNEYYVLITATTGTINPNQHWLCLTSNPSVTSNPNDACGSALQMTTNQSRVVTNALSTPNGTLCKGVVTNNIWLRWNCPPDWGNDRPVYVSIANPDCNSDFGLELSVYSADMNCGNINNSSPNCEIHYTPDTVSNFYGVFTPIPGKQYLISIDGNGGANCTFTAIVGEAPVPQIIYISTSKINVACKGEATGSATAFPRGGTSSTLYTYKWYDTPSGIQTTKTATGLPAGIYEVEVFGDNMYSGISSVIISEPTTALVLNVTQSNAKCFGEKGSIMASASGGAGGYRYKLNNGNYANASTFNNLNPGLYNVYILDAGGCERVKTIEILQPTEMLISANVNNASCEKNNGKITITTNGGGTGTLVYSKDNGANYQSGNVFEFLNTGTYTLVVKDDANCTKSITATVNNQPSPVLSTTSNNPTCFGGNGTITANVNMSTGTSPFEYSIDNGNTFQSSNVFMHAAGTYKIIVKDNNGCLDTSNNIIITNPAKIAIALSTTNTSGCGNADGTITVSASSGTPTYTFSLDSFATSFTNNSSHTFTGLAAGGYRIFVKDNNNCFRDTTIIVNSNSTLTLLLNNQDNVMCHGGNNGRIQITASGGSGMYSFSKDNTNYTALSATTSFTFNSLMAGAYNITVKDAVNCITGLALTVTEPDSFESNIIIKNAFCEPASANGEATITTTGGNGILMYSFDNGPFSTNNKKTGYASGNYSVIVRDANNCTKMYAFKVGNNLYPEVASATGINPTCNNLKDGSITINATGTGVLEYRIDTVGAVFVKNNGIFTNLSSGSYTISVRDSTGCTFTTGTIILTNPTPVSFTSNVQNESCEFNNGSIKFNAMGGNGNYQYSIDSGNSFSNSDEFLNLDSGTYFLVLKDIKGCTTKDSMIHIKSLDLPVIDSIISDSLKCSSDNNATITVYARTFSGNMLQYKLTGAAEVNYTTNNVFSGLGFGNYVVYIKDNDNCETISQPINVFAPNPLNFEIKVIDTLNCVDNMGRIKFLPSGGVMPYTFSLDGGASFNPADSEFVYTSRGPFSFMLKDNNSCTFSINNKILPIKDEPVMGLDSLSGIACFGDENGAVKVIGRKGSGNFSYRIDTVGAQFGSDSMFTNLKAGKYKFTLRDNGTTCMLTDSIVLRAPKPLLFSNVSVVPANCDADNGNINAIATGGIGGILYKIGTQTNTNGNFENLASGTYNLNIRDAQNCSKDTTLFIDRIAAPVASFISSPVLPDSVELDSARIMLTNTSINANSVLFEMGDGTVFTSNDVDYTFTSGGIYTIKLTAYGDYNCSKSISGTLVVNAFARFFIPTAFSPNEDGINSVLEIKTNGLKEFNINIFDRWGKPMFSSKSLNPVWDGKIDGANLISGVYVYTYTAVDGNNKNLKGAGTISILK